MNIKAELIRFKDSLRLKHIYYKYAKRLISDAVSHNSDTTLLDALKEAYIKRNLDILYSSEADDDIKSCIEYCRENGSHMFCYPEAQESYYNIDDVHFDETHGLYYGYWQGKKLYFKRSINNPEKVRTYLSNSLWEQSEKSPHCYLSGDFNVDDGDIIFDIGGAEGNFTLSVIDRISKAYIFECDPEWIEALNLTFANSRDKVEIVQKYVSNRNTSTEVTIDSFVLQEGIEKIGLVKMDIEGAEISVLKGASNAIKTQFVKKWAVCTYHRLTDADNIWQLLPGYNRKFTKGYIMSVPWRIYDLDKPYFVRGVLRADVRR